MKNQFMQFYDKFYLVFRGIFVFFLILFLLIPQFLISDLVRERKRRQQEVKEEVISKWASEQSIKGPMLLVPKFKNNTDAKDGYDFVWYKPNLLNISGDLDPEVKHRSLYKVVLYKTKLSFNGEFNNPINNSDTLSKGMLWHQAKMVISISDYTGMENAIVLRSNNQQSEFIASPYQTEFLSNALAAPIQLSSDSSKSQAFSFNVDLKGYEQLNFLPFARQTEISLNSPWHIPSFNGKILPDNEVNEQGFKAHWKIIDIKKTIPDQFTDIYMPGENESMLGVKLLQGQDHYSKTERSIKYAILIITLTFVVYIFIELLQKKRINAAQYLLVGASLLIFYTLLLSISEYTGFNIAYAIAASAVVIQISIYTAMIFKSTKTAIVFAILISALYVFIFSLIQLEDYALLAGSIGLFMILSLIMFISRKIQWNKNGNDDKLEIKKEQESDSK